MEREMNAWLCLDVLFSSYYLSSCTDCVCRKEMMASIFRNTLVLLGWDSNTCPFAY